MKPAVSIIVPVYNGEKTLERCVDSVLTQEYEDFELFLVNDGSTDKTREICDRYAASDERVLVIHKENSGVSESRNMAIAQAHGEYLQFLDCDDWITPDATKLLVRAAREEQADLVIADFYRVIGERLSHKGDIGIDGVMDQEAFVGCMMEKPADFYYGVLWNKLYRRDIIQEHQLQMNPEINWCEDFMFNLEYIRHARRFYALHTPIYYYVKTKGSLASQGINLSKTIKMKLTVFAYYNDFYKNVLDEEEYEKNRLQVYRFLIDAAGDGMVAPTILPGSQKLGEERSSLYLEAVEGEGVLMDEYRSRKLLDRYLEPVASQFDLTFPEIRLLLYLSHLKQPVSRRELSDYTNMSRRSLALYLQKLAARGYIRIQESREKKAQDRRLTFWMLPEAAQVEEALANVQREYDETRYQNFSEDELLQYAYLTEKIKKNMQKVLQ